MNGSLRDFALAEQPHLYVGVDRQSGREVDVCADAISLPFAPQSWDLVICTEMLEHAADWQAALTGVAEMVRWAGWLLLTTRGPGFPYHAFPHDYWRFTPQLIITALEGSFTFVDVENDPDPNSPGVVCLAQRRTRQNIQIPPLEAYPV